MPCSLGTSTMRKLLRITAFKISAAHSSSGVDALNPTAACNCVGVVPINSWAAFGPARPIPAAAGTTAKPTAPATGPLVTFSKNNKSAKIHVDQTVLELSEELGIGIENSCRVGTCGICKVKMTSGEVEMAVEDALEPDDKANGIILACQAKPKNDIAVEA